MASLIVLAGLAFGLLVIVAVVVAIALALGSNAAERRRAAAQQQAHAHAQAEAYRAHMAAQAEAQRRAEWAARDAAFRAQEAARLRAEEEEGARAAQLRREAHARRVHELTVRFGPEVAGRILRREIWVGQSGDMLVEAHGQPDDVDHKVMKTKTKQVFKFRRTGKNRYGLRVTLEDGVVVGWEDRDDAT